MGSKEKTGYRGETMELARIATRDLVTLALIITAASSSGVAAYYTSNYYQFYPTIQSLQLNISNLQFNPNQTSLNAFAIFSITNPTSYNGLTLTGFDGNYSLAAAGRTIPQGLLPSVTVHKKPLSPGTIISYNISFIGSLRGPIEIYNMIQNGTATKSQFVFSFSAYVHLSTFLDTYALVEIAYSCDGHVGSGSCTQIGTFLFTTGPSSGGGGGGGGV